jgi:hypothetical protein
MAPADVLPSYYPSQWETDRFWSAEQSRAKSIVDVPAGFPKQIESTLAWTPEDIATKQAQWKLDLSENDIAAIDAALARFEGEVRMMSD